MKILSSQFYSNCRLTRGFNEIGTHTICVSTALLYQKSELLRLIHWEWTICWVHFLARERGKTWNGDEIKWRSDRCIGKKHLNNSHVSHYQSNDVLSLYLFLGVWYTLQLINQLSFLFLKFPDVILDCVTYGIPHHLHSFPKITRHVMHFLNSRAQHWNLALCLVLQSCDCGAVFLHSFPQIYIHVFSVFVNSTVATNSFVACLTEIFQNLRSQSNTR